MANQVEIVNAVKVEEFVDRNIRDTGRHPDNRNADISSYQFSLKKLMEDLKEKLQDHPSHIKLRLVGYPESWNIQIVKCDWWRRPVLWWKLRKYRRNLLAGPWWDMMQGQWVDKHGKPLSERKIRRLGLDPDPTDDYL